MYTELLTEEKIREFQETVRLTAIDYKTKEVSKRKFKINVNGKIYYPHNENEHILTKDQLADQTFTIYFNDFGCDLKLPNYDPDYILIEEVKAKYKAFMESAMKNLGKLDEYKKARKQAKIMAEVSRREACSL